MMAELEALRQAGIDVFSVAVSDRADEGQTRDISSWPQLRNINYFLSPAVTDLTSLTEPLAAQVRVIVRSVGKAEACKSWSFNFDAEYLMFFR